MTVSAIYLTNFDFKMNKEELTDAVLAVFGEVMTKPYNEGKLKVALYPPTGNKSRAVVSGFEAKLDKLKVLARNYSVKDRYFRVSPDTNEERGADGQFVIKKPAHLRRQTEALYGHSARRFLQLFQKDFLESINVEVLKSPSQTINSAQMNRESLEFPASTTYLSQNKRQNRTIITYPNVLSKMQAISYLNHNPTFTGSDFEFRNDKGQVSTIHVNKGLGAEMPESPELEGSPPHLCLDFDYFEKENHGIVPLRLFSDDVINQSQVLHGLRSSCCKCEKSYTLTGISLNLDFVTGTCGCDYTDRVETSGFHWIGEDSTRLILGKISKNDPTLYETMEVMHEPMRDTYPDPNTYKGILFPILQDEWYATKAEFKKNYQTHATIEEADLLERTEIKIKKREVTKDVYAVHAIVRKTKLWQAAHIKMAVKKVTLTIDVQEVKLDGLIATSTKDFKGHVRSIGESDDDRSIILRIQVYCDKDVSPIPNRPAYIVGKPDKTDFHSQTHIINNWVDGKIKSQPLVHVILGNNQKWETPKETVHIRNDENTRQLINQLLNLLNDDQRSACINAINNAMSCVQGPPGTGKSFTAAIIAIILALKEKGLVVVCTPSNESADGLATKIQKILNQLGIQVEIEVIRITAKSKESAKEYSEPNQNFRLLHHLVRNQEDWQSDNLIRQILTKIQAKGEHVLLQHERKSLENHVKAIEKKIMKTAKICVVTLSTLSDSRIKSFLGTDSISTLIADEAGQITQPALLVPADMKPERIVLLGDHAQLQPQLVSFGSRKAGLEISALEWAALASSTQYPFIMLREQYRMDPKIRQMVSNVTYHGKLEDSEYIKSRINIQTRSIIQRCFKKGSIFVANINSEEKKVGTSFSNQMETNKVVEIVEGLITNGMNPSEITILSLYEAQKTSIEEALKAKSNLGLEKAAVFNVDAFQGQENECIVLSLVRTGKDIGFSRTPNRLNVAISRAKEALFIVGKMSAFREFGTQTLNAFCNELDQMGVNI